MHDMLTDKARESSRLGLGTVQFGLDYAISSQESRPTNEQVHSILDLAARGGIVTLDTANRYGTAESVLGLNLRPDHAFRIVTKTPSFQKKHIGAEDAATVTDAFAGSLEKLGQERIYGLMAHWAPDLLAEGGETLYEAMLTQKELGKTQKIGSSVYTAEHIDGLLERYSIDIIQVPLNIFDQRLIRSGHIRELAQRGVEIHVRSAFLKGLIFAEPSSLPDHFDSIKSLLGDLRVLAKTESLSLSELALGYLMAYAEISSVIVGVTSLDQLEELLLAAPVTETIVARCCEFAIDDQAILNPNFWPKFKT